MLFLVSGEKRMLTSVRQLLRPRITGEPIKRIVVKFYGRLVKFAEEVQSRLKLKKKKNWNPTWETQVRICFWQLYELFFFSS